jgi:hypothetical protein
MAVSLNGDGTITGLSTLDSVTITGLTSLTTTDLTADTTTLVVDSANNLVGVGTNSPNDITGTGLRQLVVGNNSGNNGVIVNCSSSGDSAYSFAVNNVKLARVGYDYLNNMTFQTNNAEKMRITSSGNVGIGTSSPTYRLQVQDGLYTLLAGADSSASTLTDATQKVMRFGVPHYTNAEEPVGVLFSSITSGENAVLIGGGTGVFNAATRISFHTAANTTTLTGTERMRIDSNGNVGIGLTNPSEMLEVNGNAHFRGTSANSAALQLGQFSDLAYNPLVQMFCDDVSGDIFDIRLGRYVSDFRWSRSSSDGITQVAKLYSGGGNPRSTQFYLYEQDTGAATSTTKVYLNTSGNSYLNGGNVGIGTSSPTAKLQSYTTGSTYALILDNNNAVGVDQNYISFNSAGTATIGRIYRPSSTNFLSLDSNYNGLIFKTGSSGTATERMRIDSNGYVTEPNKPMAFAVSAPATSTSPGSPVVLKYANPAYNPGSHYNATTGLFTCPVAGRYKVTQHCMVDSVLTTYALNVSINKNGGGVTTGYTSNTGYNINTCMAIISCAANDTLSATLNHGGKHAGYDSFTVEFLG